MAEKALIQKAIQYALVAHDLQVRKGTIIPYIFHPLEVGTIIAKYDQNATNLICAGILHDTIEDTGTSAELIEKLFGPDIAELVVGETEDKSKCWCERKQHTIDYLKDAPEAIKIIACADKLSNMRDIEREFNKDKSVFEKFNAPGDKKQSLAWYYRSVVESLQPLSQHAQFAGMYDELTQCVKRVFELEEARALPATKTS